MSRRDPSPDLNEQSPLIAAQDTGQNADVENGALSDPLETQDHPLESKNTFYLILLTLSIGGLQIVWSVELSNGSPYLLSLGMSKALVAFVWLAGPLTGVLVQPYIGIVSDRSRISWGKRKPFMVAGAAGTVVSSLLLAYAKDIVRFIGRWSADDEYGGWWMGLTITLATILMWCLDFAINTVQAAIRAFIVDNAPAHQQDSANAWASRMTGFGNILGYVCGYLDLPKHFRFLGNTQFKVLCMIASIAISSTVLISSLAIKERNPQDDAPSQADHQSSGILSFFKQTFRSIKRLTPTVRSVCEIQFFHWIGWFPFLFYITTYIGQLYVNPRLRPDMTKEEIDQLWAQATRVGTLALLVEAIVTLSANLLLPLIIAPTYEPLTARQKRQPPGPDSHTGVYGGSLRGNNADHGGFSSVLSSNLPFKDRIKQLTEPLQSANISSIFRRIRVPGLTLRRTWLMSQILHALCMFSTFFISTPTAGTVMVAFVGIAWALTLWAPFALISADIARRDEERRLRHRHRHRAGRFTTTAHSEESRGLMGMHDSAMAGTPAAEGPIPKDDEADEEALHDTQTATTHNDNNEEEDTDRAGIVLGLHNVAVSFPQIIATLICSGIFKALQKDRSEPGDVSVAWTLRMAGIAALVAAWFTYRMKETVR